MYTLDTDSLSDSQVQTKPMRFDFGLSENDSIRIRIVIGILAETGGCLTIDELHDFFAEMSTRINDKRCPGLYPSSKAGTEEFLSRAENADCLRLENGEISVDIMGLLGHGFRSSPESHAETLQEVVAEL